MSPPEHFARPIAPTASLSAASAAGAPATNGRVVALDGIRALAVLSVLVHHSWVTTPANLGERLVLRTLNLSVGVNVFLVLSGLLVTRSLLAARAAPHAFRDFYLRRQLRIAPLYFGFLLVVLVLVPWLLPTHATQIPDGSRVWLFTYTANIRIAMLRGWNAVPQVTSLFWSLALQEQFFLFWPLVVLFCRERTMRRICVALVLAAPLVRLALLRWDPSSFAALMLLPARADTLALGALIALLAREPAGMRLLRRWSVPVLASAAALLALMSWPDRGLWSATSPLVVGLGLSLLAIFAAGMSSGALVASRRGGAVRLLSSAAMGRIGRYSYCVYVVHAYVLSVLASHVVRIDAFPRIGASLILGQLAFTVAGALSCLLIGWASWELCERHLVAFGNRFRSRPAPAPPTLPPAVAPPEGASYPTGERARVPF